MIQKLKWTLSILISILIVWIGIKLLQRDPPNYVEFCFKEVNHPFFIEESELKNIIRDDGKFILFYWDTQGEVGSIYTFMDNTKICPRKSVKLNMGSEENPIYIESNLVVKIKLKTSVTIGFPERINRKTLLPWMTDSNRVIEVKLNMKNYSKKREVIINQ